MEVIFMPYGKLKHRKKVYVQYSFIVFMFAIILIGLSQNQMVGVSAEENPETFKNFESPQVHPLSLTPDGTQLLAVNSPDNRLSVFDLTNGTPKLVKEIPVGLEPVSVAVRNNDEAWVVNWLSDSISIVDLKNGNVIRTIDVGDEPTDIVFAGLNNEKAFVSIAGFDHVKVFDVGNPTEVPQVINIRGKQPRALTKDSTGTQVFVSVFESGNQTTILDPNQVKAAGGQPKVTPKRPKKIGKAPEVGLIVKFNGSKWVDDTGDSRFSSLVPYKLADVDIVVLDASSTNISVKTEVRGVGTHISNTILDPITNRLYVANTESLNLLRFEPNLNGRFIDNRVTLIDFSNNTTPVIKPVDLNPHIDYSNPKGSQSERELSLALPGDIVQSNNGQIFITANGSSKVGVLDANGLVTGRIKVGEGPTGLAIDDSRQQLYVLNRFEQTLSVVNTASLTEVSKLPIGFNPEPETVTKGRQFLYGTSLSAHGTVSCANCHRNGHWDGLAWDLGNPKGKFDVVRSGPFTSNFDPMKGPMTSQSLRGIIGTEPLHWRGDRSDIKKFNPTFEFLLGGKQLNPQELDAFANFIKTLTYPPNPFQNLDRTYPDSQTGPSAARGFDLFVNQRLDGRATTAGQGAISCNACHVATNSGTGTSGQIIPARFLGESQDFKIPQLRGIYQKTGFDRGFGEHIRGFGFLHDGSVDNLLNFLRLPAFNFKDDQGRLDVEAMIMAFDTGTAPAVGVQITLNASNKTNSALLDKLTVLMSQFDAKNADLVVKGLFNGVQRGAVYVGKGNFMTDKTGEDMVNLQTLIDNVKAGSEITFTGVPFGSGRRIGIDRDSDGIPDGSDNNPTNARQK
jgi:YVTN family beta-propeller protein